MSEPFLGEIRAFGFGFAPQGWTACDGQLLAINDNQSLYSLLGTTYGGDGRTSFALPDLRGRVPIDAGPVHAQGRSGGAEAQVLQTSEMPGHTHAWLAASTTGDTARPTDALLASSPATNPAWAGPATPPATMGGIIATAGQGQGHQNMQPFLVLQFCIALKGIFPSRP